ncbi:MAG: hypothetical protein MJA32_01490, partial [Proteobacteria bacterium]|nr:hypothetical protein [Pseudomonadota bacterium]
MMTVQTFSGRRAAPAATILGCLVACGAAERPAAVPAPDVDVVRYVDPFIGTAGDHGQLHPGAGIPFGM